MNDNKKPLSHPLILEAAKACKDCGYTLGRTTIQSHKDHHPGQKVTTTKVIMAHGGKDIPFKMHQFISKKMSPVSLNNHTLYSNPTREVTLKAVKSNNGGHELHFHAIRYGK